MWACRFCSLVLDSCLALILSVFELCSDLIQAIKERLDTSYIGPISIARSYIFSTDAMQSNVPGLAYVWYPFGKLQADRPIGHHQRHNHFVFNSTHQVGIYLHATSQGFPWKMRFERRASFDSGSFTGNRLGRPHLE